MSIFDKTRYLRTLFVLLPMGIAFTYWGIEGVTKSADDLPYTKGVVLEARMEGVYDKTCKCYKNTLLIYLQGHESPYKTTIVKKIDVLDPVLSKGQNIEIWTWDKTDDNQIEQVKLNDELIVPYNRTTGLYLGTLAVGLSLIILCVFYIIKSPEDLFGKKRA